MFLTSRIGYVSARSTAAEVRAFALEGCRAHAAEATIAWLASLAPSAPKVGLGSSLLGRLWDLLGRHLGIQL